VNDIIGQVNAQQVRATIIRMALAGSLAALAVLQQKLPEIWVTTTPLISALAWGIGQLIYYLKQGEPITGRKP
jgi:hypothetical protein